MKANRLNRVSPTLEAALLSSAHILSCRLSFLNSPLCQQALCSFKNADCQILFKINLLGE